MSTPVRLNKKESKTTAEAWILNHAHIFLPIAFVLLIILLVLLCYAVTGVSAVESGGMRNFINRGMV